MAEINHDELFDKLNQSASQLNDSLMILNGMVTRATETLSALNAAWEAQLPAKIERVDDFVLDHALQTGIEDA
ncbi:MAG: hypothetical protein H6974_12835 [Gammaproteobacteria bacterium]|nr:hypothetical protein [Gammaproteobacteria bacterium]